MWFFQKKPKVEIPKGPALACVHTGYCSKEQCPMWIAYDKQNPDGSWKHQPEGKCTFAWTPQLLIELRDQIKDALRPTVGS